MECEKCKKSHGKHEKPYFGGFCKGCFCRLMEKRVRKRIRQEHLIRKNEILIVKDKICLHFVREAVRNMPVEIRKCGAGKKILPWTMDNEINEFLDGLFSGVNLGKKHELPEKNKKNEVKLFLNITDNELNAYAEAKNIRFKKKTSRKYEKYRKLLDKLEEKHHETRASLYKSLGKLKEIIIKSHFPPVYFTGGLLSITQSSGK